MPVFDRYQKIKSYLLGSQDPNELAALQAEEELAQDTRNVAGIGSGVDKIISAIGGTQANPEPYTQMQKLAGEGPARVREYLKQKYQQQQAAGQTAATMASAEEQADATRQKQAAEAAREAAKGTPGQQEYDKNVHKEKFDWESSGRVAADQGLERLKAIKEKIKNKSEGYFDKARARTGQEGLYSDSDLEIRQEVTNAVIPMLKSFGSNPSEGERKTLIDSYYDPRLSKEKNIENIETKILENEQMKNNKETRLYGNSGPSKKTVSTTTKTPKLIRVRQKATGRTGSIPENELTDEYEVLQ